MVSRSLTLLFFSGLCLAQSPTPLWLRGYSVIPTPRDVRLSDGDVRIDNTWVLDAGDHAAAVRTLRADLPLRSGTAGSVIRLSAAAGAVATGAEPGIDRQAYRLRIDDRLIEITGNAEPGLFYGVQTLLQLRFLHWDTKHHQDRMETLKRYLDWSAKFKVNMIGFELEDKFDYPSHPVIGAPGAFTTAQLQEIVNFGLERHIQVVPEVQSPAHFAYVLKHPEFADLRADGNNYQSDLCDPRTYDLIFSMYDDAIKATRGVDYFFVSTDEVYYAGIDGKCKEPYNETSRSLKWVEFVQKANAFLKARGRRILVWAEYPLLPEHVKMIPPDVIDGVIGSAEYLKTENELGMRQLSYNSMQGGEYLFPDHLSRLQQAFENIAHGRVWQGKPLGVFGAAWDDTGLHNETFWLGWSAVAQWGWLPGRLPNSASPEQHAAEFMHAYYGPRAEGMIEIYRAMHSQARSWGRSWDRVTSRERGPGYGNSYGKGRGTERRDMTLSPPPLPAMPDLQFAPAFAERYKAFLADARDRALENDRLVHALHSNFPRVDRNRYNLEVFLAIAKFTGHHWRLLEGLAGAEQSLQQAAAQKANPRQAVGHMVAAYNRVDRLRKEGEATFAELQSVYEKSRYPKGQSVAGHKFVHILDDTKDHWADRTPDLSFMTAPERSIGLEKWQKDLYQIIQAYAKQHNVPIRGLGEARLEE